MNSLHHSDDLKIPTKLIREALIFAVLILLTATPFVVGQTDLPKGVDPRTSAELDLTFKAMDRVNVNDWDGAIWYVNQAILRGSRDPESMAGKYALRSSLWEEKKDFKRALADSAMAIKLDPNKPSHYYDRARTFVEIGELDRALADSQKALDLKPDDQVATQIRGEVHFARKEYDLAILDFNRSMELNADSKDPQAVLKLRAEVYRAQGK